MLCVRQSLAKTYIQGHQNVIIVLYILYRDRTYSINTNYIYSYRRCQGFVFWKTATLEILKAIKSWKIAENVRKMQEK